MSMWFPPHTVRSNSECTMFSSQVRLQYPPMGTNQAKTTLPSTIHVYLDDLATNHDALA